MRTTQTFKDGRARLATSQTESRKEVHAENYCCELRKAGQTNQVQRHDPAKRTDRADPKVAEYKTGHHHEKPKEENFFFHAHGHPPRPFSVLGRSAWTCRGRKRTLGLLDRRRRLRLRRFVADQAHLAEEFRYLHAGKRFKKRGHLRGNLGDVPGQLVRAGGIAVSSGNDGHLIHFAERLAESRTISGNPVNSLSITAAWLYSWKASALTFMALASASPFLKIISASASPCARIAEARPSASVIER